MSRPPAPWDEPPAPAAQVPKAARTADLFAEWDAMHADLGEIEARADAVRDAALAAVKAEYRELLREPQAPATLVVSFTVPGPPRGQGRPRSAPLMREGKPVIGKGGRPIVVVHRDAKSASYESLIRLAAAQALGDREPTALPIEVEIDAYRVPAPSWAKRTQRLALAGGLSAAGKPDPDNIAKAVLDGCNGVVWLDDAQVVDLVVRKRFAALARLEVRVAWTGLKAP